ncbi:precorrin-2 dehydrogenase, partial [Fusobacterium animalis ATCC 51191]
MKKVANKFFPVSIDLNNKNILVIGAGKIALRKVETLMGYNCNILIITKDILEEKFLELEKNNKIKILKNQEFEEKFLE